VDLEVMGRMDGMREGLWERGAARVQQA